MQCAPADALRLLILAGSREGEVLSAMWKNFDLKRGIRTKPSYHTKQKKIEHVPLSKGALLILKRMEKQRMGPYLFPGRGDGPRVSLRRPWHSSLCGRLQGGLLLSPASR